MQKKKKICCLVILGMSFITCVNNQPTPSTGEIQTATWNKVSTLTYGSATQESLNANQTQMALEITPTTTEKPTPDFRFHTDEVIPFEQSKILTQSEFPKNEKVNVTLPRIAGNYLVFLAGHGYEYVSLDGTIRGQFLEFSAEQLGLASLTLGNDPRLIFVNTTSDPDEQRLKNLSIFETGLDGSPLGAWVGNVSSDYWCIEPIGRIVNFPAPAFFLDNWFAVDCFHAGGHSINLVNLKLGSVKSIFVNCKFVGDIAFMSYVDTQSNFFWSETGTEFAYHCPFGEYYFVSILNDQAIVKQVGDGRLRILSVSPDWKKIAFDMGYSLLLSLALSTYTIYTKHKGTEHARAKILKEIGVMVLTLVIVLFLGGIASMLANYQVGMRWGTVAGLVSAIAASFVVGYLVRVGMGRVIR
jgi:hypothetical protein